MSYIAYKKKALDETANGNTKGKGKKKRNQNQCVEAPVDINKLQYLKEVYPRKDEIILMRSLQDHDNDIAKIVSEYHSQAKLEEVLTKFSNEIEQKTNFFDKYDVNQLDNGDAANESSLQYKMIYNELIEQLKEQNIVSEDELDAMMKYCSSNIGVWMQIQDELIFN